MNESEYGPILETRETKILEIRALNADQSSTVPETNLNPDSGAQNAKIFLKIFILSFF